MEQEQKKKNKKQKTLLGSGQNKRFGMEGYRNQGQQVRG